MRVTIIVPDSLMSVDNRWFKISMIGVDSNLSVVQWKDDKGLEEWINGGNTVFTDQAKYAFLLTRWNAARDIADTPPTQDELDAIAAAEARSAEILEAQDTSGVSKLTVDQAENYIDNHIGEAATTAEKVDAIRRILKKMVPYLLK